MELVEQLEHPLRPLNATWEKVVQAARKYKHDHFSRDAAEAMVFFRARTREVWAKYLDGEDGVIYPNESFYDLPADERMCVAKGAEMLQLFGPGLYPRNPTRTCEPLRRDARGIELFGNPEDPFVQQMYQGLLQQHNQEEGVKAAVSGEMGVLLNYTARELKLYREFRRVVDEALLKGAGIFVHELIEPYPGGRGLVGSRFESIDNLLRDPDVKVPERCLWQSIECEEPYWVLAQRYGLSEGQREELRAKARSPANASGYTDQSEESHRDDEELTAVPRSSRSNVNVRYYKIYSKMGLGDWLTGIDERLRGKLPAFGQFCYLVLVPGLGWFLNLPSPLVKRAMKGDAQAQQECIDRAQWPTPFWADGSWPMTPVEYHEDPDCVWPIAHLHFGISYLKIINWIMSTLARKVKVAGHDALLYDKQQLEKEVAQNIFSGVDYAKLGVKTDGNPLRNFFEWAQTPEFNPELYRVLQAMMSEFDKAVGLPELLYGTSTPDRSASESQIKQENATSRIDDMREKTLDVAGELARKEAMMNRWLMDDQMVRPVLGPMGTAIWRQHVMTSDIEWVVREYEYSIEGDTAARPNRQTQLAFLSDMLPNILPHAMNLVAQGMVKPYNDFMHWFATLNSVPPERFLMPEPEPQEGPSPEEQQAQLEMQMKEQEQQLKAQEMQLKAQIEQLKASLDMEKARAEIEAKRAEMEMDRAAFMQKQMNDALAFRQELRQDQQQHQQEMEQTEAEGELKLELAERAAAQKARQQAQQQANKPKTDGQ